MGSKKVIIITALIDGREFNFHHNVLITPNTSLQEYLAAVEDSIVQLYNDRYPIDVVPYFMVKVWNMDMVSNKNIKINRTKKTKKSKNVRTYHTDSKDSHSKNNYIRPLGAKDAKNKIFSTMDLETMDFNGVQHPVAISIAYNVNESKLFLIDKDLITKDLDTAVSKLWEDYWNFILKNSQHFKCIFVHNLGSFDGYFIYKALSKILDPEALNTIIDDQNKFIQITVNYNDVKIIWKDSYRIFPLSLNDLCTNFNVDGKSSKYNLEYNNLDLFNKTELLEEFKKYSLQDSVSLLKALVNAQAIYTSSYNIDITDSGVLSTSSLSLKIFRTHFLNHNIPILKSWSDNFIRKAYLGGATDYYKAYGRNLKYYDVNSLYPFAMCKPMPFEIIKEHKDMTNIPLESFFGFCLAEIKTPKDINIPLLPYRYQGKTIFPRGSWIDVYFSEELKAVVAQGYEVSLIRGYEFSKIDLFSEYVKHFFENKKLAKTPAERLIAKMHLNQLYGAFGRKQEVLETINIPSSELSKYVSTRIVKNVIEINSKISTVLLVNNMNKQIINELNTTLDMKIDNKYFGQVRSNVAIAAAVTAYARVHMIKYKLNGNIYYTDTDSVFLDESLKVDELGKGLGLMKDELDGLSIDEAYFLGIKRYGYHYKDKSNNTLEKSVFAGIKRNSLTFDEVKSVFNGGVLVKFIPVRFYRTFNNLSISVKSTTVTIKMNNEKILKENNYIPKTVYITNHSFDDRTLYNKLKNKIVKLLKKYIKI